MNKRKLYLAITLITLGIFLLTILVIGGLNYQPEPNTLFSFLTPRLLLKTLWESSKIAVDILVGIAKMFGTLFLVVVKSVFSSWYSVIVIVGLVTLVVLKYFFDRENS